MKEQQIDKQAVEEMARVLCDDCRTRDTDPCKVKMCAAVLLNAEALYNAGYRKQSEGKWIKDEVGETLCSQCGNRPLYRKSGTTFATTFYPTRSNFCPNCGAKMKGGKE